MISLAHPMLHDGDRQISATPERRRAGAIRAVVPLVVAALSSGTGCSPKPSLVCDEGTEPAGSWTMVPLPTVDGNSGPRSIVGPVLATQAELLLVEEPCAGCVVAALQPSETAWDVTDVNGSLLVTNSLAGAGAAFVLLHGGYDGSQTGPLVPVSSSSLLDRTAGTWTTMAAPDLQTHLYSTIHWTGEEFLLFGGVESHSDSPKTTDETEFTSQYDGLFFDPEVGQWRELPPAREPAEHVYGINPPGGQTAAAWTNRGLFVWGLTPDQSGTWGRLFDANEEVWRDVSLDSGPVRLRGHRLLTVGDDVFVHGGTLLGDPPAESQRRMWRYSLSDDTWEEIDVPSFADPFKGTVVGGKLAFIGHCAAGSLFDPAANEWQVLSSAGAPPPSDGVPLGVGDFLTVSGAYYADSEEEIPAVFVLDLSE